MTKLNLIPLALAFFSSAAFAQPVVGSKLLCNFGAPSFKDELNVPKYLKKLQIRGVRVTVDLGEELSFERLTEEEANRRDFTGHQLTNAKLQIDVDSPSPEADVSVINTLPVEYADYSTPGYSPGGGTPESGPSPASTSLYSFLDMGKNYHEHSVDHVAQTLDFRALINKSGQLEGQLQVNRYLCATGNGKFRECLEDYHVTTLCSIE